MNKPKYNPDDFPHPGETLLSELEDIGISQRAFAHFIGCKADELVDICSCQAPMTAKMACKVATALGTTPRKWLEMQNHYDLARVDPIEYENLRRLGSPESGEEETESNEQ